MREWDWLVRYHGLLFSGWSVGRLVGWLGRVGSRRWLTKGQREFAWRPLHGETATGDSERVDAAVYCRLEEWEGGST
jgi:hypothetical protein